jgi:tetraacyldisaccharide 4'-kinase
MLTTKLYHQWYSKLTWGYLLWPLSVLYSLWVHLRFYQYHLLEKYLRCNKLPVPVIVVGNLTVGGNGKTPFTIALAKLATKEGFQVGIIACGYKGKKINAQKALIVQAHSTSQDVGDEAVLLADETTCLVAACKNRRKSAEALIKLGCNLLISDDGIQHLNLQADLRILLINAQYKFGNGAYLPMGPVKVPKLVQQRCNYILHYGEKNHNYGLYLKNYPIRNIHNPCSILSIKERSQKKIIAITAIAHPEAFFNALKKLKITFKPIIFPDHYIFKPEDLNFDSHTILIMTSKDRVKCLHFNQKNLWFLPTKVEIPSTLQQQLVATLRKLSPSNH